MVNYAASHNFCVAVKHYNINRTTINSWPRQVEALRGQPGHRCRLGGGGRRPVMDVHMEKELENWDSNHANRIAGANVSLADVDSDFEF